MRGATPPLNRAQWGTIGLLLITLIPQTLAAATLNQAYSILYVWSEKAVDRTILGFEMPISWILIADGIFAIIGMILADRLWRRLAKTGREPNNLVKIGIGCAMLVVGYLVIALLARLPVVPLIGWLGFFLIIDFSVGWYRPPSQALIAGYAPASAKGMMMAVSGLAEAFGFFLMGYLGRFFEPLGPSLYFLLVAALPVGGMVMMFAFHRPIMRRLQASV